MHMQLFKHSLTLGLVFIISAFLTLYASLSSPLSIEVENAQLTLSATDISLPVILHEFEDQTNIRIRFMEPMNEIITARMENVPLDQAIKLLLRNFNHTASYHEIIREDTSTLMPEIVVTTRIANLSSPIVYSSAAAGHAVVASSHSGPI